MNRVLVDADACPVKDEILRVAQRLEAEVVFVANRRMRLVETALVRQVVVSGGFDAADDWIAENAQAGDVVVTADIMLADRCLKREAQVLGPDGRAFTPANIGSAIAMRALNRDLRDMGAISGAGPAFARTDRSRFLQELDRILRRLQRQ